MKRTTYTNNHAAPEGIMTIIAKYAGRCQVCGGHIAAGEEIEWSKAEGARHTKCPVQAPPTEPDPNAIELGGGSGNGCRGWTVGQVVRMNDRSVEGGTPRWVVITRSDREYVREDGLSCGVGNDTGYLYYADARPATPEEYGQRETERNAEIARQQAKKDLAVIFQDEIKDESNWVDGENLDKPEGETIPVGRQDLRVYGTGDTLVITDDHVYAMELCGADGDAWNGNFGATCRGWSVPADNELVNRIRAANRLV